VDLHVGQVGQRPARRRSRNGELAAPVPRRCRGRRRPLPQSLFHKAGDDVLQAHAVQRGPGLRLTEQLIGEIDRGPHALIFMLLCAMVKLRPGERRYPSVWPLLLAGFFARSRWRPDGLLTKLLLTSPYLAYPSAWHLSPGRYLSAWHLSRGRLDAPNEEM
jgi:hypothetical protein